MQGICNLISQNSMQIADIFYFYRTNIIGVYGTQNQGGKNIIRLVNKKFEKNLK